MGASPVVIVGSPSASAVRLTPTGLPTATATHTANATATVTATATATATGTAPRTTGTPTPTVTPGTLPTLQSMPTPAPVSLTPSPPPGNAHPDVGVTQPEATCDADQGISGYNFVPRSTVTVLTRVPGSADIYPAGTTTVLDDGAFNVVVPAATLMPWCDPASGVAAPGPLWELNIEVWTTSDAAGRPTQPRDPHAIFPLGAAPQPYDDISPDEAIQRVNGYLGGEPQAAGPGATATMPRLSEEGQADGTRYRVVVDAGPGLPPDEYIVDGASGAIVGVYYPRATSRYALLAARDVPEEEALARARAWAAATFEGFDQLELVRGMTQGGFPGVVGQPPADRVYTAEWRLRDPVSGGWLPTGIKVSVDLDTDRELSLEVVPVGHGGPALYLSADQPDCQTAVTVSGVGFLPGTTVRLFGWAQGGNTVALATDALTADEGGTFQATLALTRFTGCGPERGPGFYRKRFGLDAVTVRNPDDPDNQYADPAASATFDLLDYGTEGTATP